MRRTTTIRAVLPLLALAACQTAPPGPMGATPADPASCGADRLQGMIGARAAEVQQAAGLAITRVHEAGNAITQDFLPERLNIVTDSTGTVVALRCG